MKLPLPRLGFALIFGWFASCGDAHSPEEDPGVIQDTGSALLGPVDTRDYLTIHFTGAGAGTVTLWAGGVSPTVCSLDCTQRFPRGTQVLVSVTPKHGSFIADITEGVNKCAATVCSVTVRSATRVSVNLGLWDDEWAARRLDLIRLLWNQDTIPSWPPSLVENLGGAMPAPMGPALVPANYSLDGDFFTPNLDHYERWSMRPAPDVHGLGYFGGAGSWSWAPFAPVPGQDPHVSEPQAYVPVLYFAPTSATTKFFIIHDGHAPYGQPGHRSLARWALDHGFGVAVVIMPYFSHGLEKDWALWPQDYGDSMRIYFEAATNTISHAQTLGYDTFVMEGLSGGGWTTHFIAALDTRVAVSYPIAGSMPFDMPVGGASGPGDYEQQQERAVYDIAVWEDLYAMSASNGRHATQIFNEFDWCCFTAAGREAQIQAYATAANASTSGTFRTLVDKGSGVHDVSAWSIQAIENDLRGLGIIK